jgi:hypothetical protein
LKIVRQTEVKIGDDGVTLNELLLVSRIIYSLLNKVNHVKVEYHMAPPPHTLHITLNSPIPNLSIVKYLKAT